jgi:hypothetical protein
MYSATQHVCFVPIADIAPLQEAGLPVRDIVILHHQFSDVAAVLVRCGHVSGLFVRPSVSSLHSAEQASE